MYLTKVVPHSIAFVALLAICASAQYNDAIPPNTPFPPANATGTTSFKPPVYLNNTDAPGANWTFHTSVFRNNVPVLNLTGLPPNYGKPFDQVSWFTTPPDVNTTGPTIDRDICLVALLFNGSYTIDHILNKNSGNNGCDSAWGSNCSAAIQDELVSNYKHAINKKGQVDCYTYQFDLLANLKKSTSIRTSCGESFSIMDIYRDSIGGYAPTSTNESVVHGNYTYSSAQEWGVYQNTSSESLESIYDKAVRGVHNSFFVTGPIYGSNKTEVTVDMVCVQPDTAIKGSLPIPGTATSGGNGMLDTMMSRGGATFVIVLTFLSLMV